jgi:hypothetical protein
MCAKARDISRGCEGSAGMAMAHTVYVPGVRQAMLRPSGDDARQSRM